MDLGVPANGVIPLLDDVDLLKAKNCALEEQIAQLKRKNTILMVNVDQLENESTKSQKEIAELKKQIEIKNNQLFTHNDFSMDKIKTKPDLLTYTGFDSREMYETFREFINPGSQHSRSTKLSVEDQMLLLLAKLRQGFDFVDLAFRLNCTKKHASKIFNNWINAVYFRLGCLNIWPHQTVLFDHSPTGFKEKYPTTFIILDGTEMKIECFHPCFAISVIFNIQESSNTAKGLIGYDPKGGIIFLSQPCTGSISDKKITQLSSLY